MLESGLGVSSPASSIAHVFGPCASGPLNTPTSISNPRQLKDTFGLHGPLVDTVGYILDHAGGPVIVTRTSEATVATYDGASTDALTSSSGAGVDNEINLAIADGAPKNDYELLFTIVAGGTVGQTTFNYSLDGGNSRSPSMAAGATISLGDSGVVAHFETGTTAPYVAGATYSTVAKAARPSATNLGTAFDAIQNSLLNWDFFVMAGAGGTSGEQRTLASTLSTRLASLVTSRDRYFRLIMGAGESAVATELTDWANFVDSRILRVYGSLRSAPTFSIVGRGLPLLAGTCRVGALAAGNLISTDLGQTSGAASVGAAPGAVSISHDEFLTGGGLQEAKISTFRTYPNLTGFFLTDGLLSSGVGSDFEFWQHGRIMDQACRIVSQQHSLLISSSVITKADGTGALTEFSAQAIEKRVQRALDNVIGSALRGIGPATIDGTIGHVSDIRYQVDRTNNVLSTKQIIATVSIVPRGYLKTLTATLSFKLST